MWKLFKTSIWLVMLLPAFHAASQQSNDSGKMSPLSLRIVCFKEEVLTKQAMNLIISLDNQSRNNFLVPSKLFPADAVGFGNLLFDIIDSDKDTLPSFGADFNSPYRANELTVNLKPMEKKLYEVVIPDGYFEKAGLYKIRFYFAEKYFDSKIDKIFSEWVTIKVK